jgi:hypothetical protein
MRVEDFELPELCQLCRGDLASVYVVVTRATFTAKAHVCFSCFGELEECGRPCVEPVSLQEFQETVETDESSEECRVQNGLPEQPVRNAECGLGNRTNLKH